MTPQSGHLQRGRHFGSRSLMASFNAISSGSGTSSSPHSSNSMSQALSRRMPQPGSRYACLNLSNDCLSTPRRDARCSAADTNSWYVRNAWTIFLAVLGSAFPVARTHLTPILRSSSFIRPSVCGLRQRSKNRSTCSRSSRWPYRLRSRISNMSAQMSSRQSWICSISFSLRGICARSSHEHFAPNPSTYFACSVVSR